MGRGVESQAINNSGTAQNLSKGLNTTATGELGGLMPAFESEINNPVGFAPTDLAKMNTAAQQSAGGSVAGAVGQGGLEAARTRNAGAPGVALDEASRQAGRNLSNNAIGIEGKNALLKENQRQEGLHGMQGLYDTNLGATLSALGLSNQALGTATSAANETNQGFMAPFQAIADLGTAGSGAGALGLKL
jgi:hypothetical protein